MTGRERQLHETAARLQEFIREHVAGGCRWLSLGSACPCPLCDVDRLLDAALAPSGNRAEAGRARLPEDDLFGGDPGRCPECGAAFEWVRPGKSQSTCRCWARCPVHGDEAIAYHEVGKPVERMGGYFCLQCEGYEDQDCCRHGVAVLRGARCEVCDRMAVEGGI